MNGAIIIETRNIPKLDEIIMDKHMKFLPKDWGLTILHSNANEKVLKNIDAKKTNIQIENLPNFRYNRLLTSEWFWENLGYEKVLVFQSDSEILREGIEEFVDVDYIGAPWKFQDEGGNGGLSLRTSSIMIDVIKKFPYMGMSNHGNEDVYFSNHVGSMQVKGKVASLQQAYKFSCESIFKLGTFGCHAIDKYLTTKECQQIRTQYDS